MPEFRKKPVTVQAIRLEKQPDWKEIREFFGSKSGAGVWRGVGDSVLISTLEGVTRADTGDWIIKGVAGEFYPCKHDIFLATYEAVS